MPAELTYAAPVSSITRSQAMQRLHSYYAALLAGSALLRVRVQLADICSSAERERLHAVNHWAAFSDVRKRKY